MGVAEIHPSGGQPVKVRRLDDRISRTPHGVIPVLVRKQKEDIGAIVAHVVFLPDVAASFSSFMMMVMADFLAARIGLPGQPGRG